MRKFLTVMITLAFAVITLPSGIAVNASTFERSIPAYGLYCEDENAVAHGKVKYVIDEKGKAVQYSKYKINTDGELNLYIPFISSEYNIPAIDIAEPVELCYGKELFGETEYDFYSANIDGLTGTLYTLTAKEESFTVDFEISENSNYIYDLTRSYKLKRDNKHITYELEMAQVGAEYGIFIINGSCLKIESTAEISEQSLSVKEYIDKNFSEYKNFYSSDGEAKPDLFYALANIALANNINYGFFDFFVDSYARLRLNAYKFTVKESCTVTYSMPVEVQTNYNFEPAIYKSEAVLTGNYKVDYSIEVNKSFPYILECSTKLSKQADNLYTAENVNGDFYFIFSSVKNPESLYGNGGMEAWRIALLVLAGVMICVSVSVLIFFLIKSKRS